MPTTDKRVDAYLKAAAPPARGQAARDSRDPNRQKGGLGGERQVSQREVRALTRG